MARARAAADEVEVAAKAITLPRRARQDTVPPPVPAMLEPMDSGDWPKTEPLGAIDYEDYTSPTREVVRARLASRPPVTPKAPPVREQKVIVAVTPARKPVAADRTTARMAAVDDRKTSREITAVGDQTTPGIAAIGDQTTPGTRAAPRFERAKSPSTIIPVPRLPRITDTMPIVDPTRRNFEPVVSPRRAPKGTPAPAIGVSPPPPIRSGDETRPGISAAPLPRIPSIKRTAPRG